MYACLRFLPQIVIYGCSGQHLISYILNDISRNRKTQGFVDFMTDEKFCVFLFRLFCVQPAGTGSGEYPFGTQGEGGAGMVDIHSDEYILGQNIRKYRLEKKWSQSDLSNAMNIDRADISKYENGSKGEMGFKTLKRFAEVLGVTADQLLHEEAEWRPQTSSTYNQLTDGNKAMINQMMAALLLQQKQTTQATQSVQTMQTVQSVPIVPIVQSA